MDTAKLRTHIQQYLQRMQNDPAGFDAMKNERRERKDYYQFWKKDRLLSMTEDDFSEYISKLWAMLTWGNKDYYVQKIIADNGFEKVKKGLADLLYSDEPLAERWDKFREEIKDFGPARAD